MYADAVRLAFGGLGLVGLIGAIAEQRTFERGFQECVEAIDIMAIAGHGELEGNASIGGEDQVLADTMEVRL